ncbi:MAG: TlpA disulfide reductase family protein, partial [Hydrogenophaga sp.]
PELENGLQRRDLILLMLATVGTTGRLSAATPNGAPAPQPTVIPELAGTSGDGQALQLAAFRGRVVMVFYWATGCAVCRDKMRELRANLMGWQSQPFTLLGVNMDTRKQDWLDYERLVGQTIPAAQRFASVWAGGTDFRDTMGRPAQLPSVHLINKEGRLVEQYRGRVPAETWDRVADLL